MTSLPAPLKTTFDLWSKDAASAAETCRTLFLDAAQRLETGPLEESLKWGQPAWRPTRPRIGSTLRMWWKAELPNRLSLYVDCKTDLAARVQDIYPEMPFNDGRREIGVALDGPLPEQVLSHLAEMTFTYHRARRAG